jgi:hypothetical protein
MFYLALHQRRGKTVWRRNAGRKIFSLASDHLLCGLHVLAAWKELKLLMEKRAVLSLTRAHVLLQTLGGCLQEDTLDFLPSLKLEII